MKQELHSCAFVDPRGFNFWLDSGQFEALLAQAINLKQFVFGNAAALLFSVAESAVSGYDWLDEDIEIFKL